MTPFEGILIGLAAGGLSGYLIASARFGRRSQTLREDLAVKDALLLEHRQAIERLGLEKKQLRTQLEEAISRHSAAEARLEALEKADREKQALLEDSRKNWRKPSRPFPWRHFSKTAVPFSSWPSKILPVSRGRPKEISSFDRRKSTNSSNRSGNPSPRLNGPSRISKGRGNQPTPP